MKLSEMKVFSDYTEKNSTLNTTLKMMGFYSEESQYEVKQEKTLEHEIIMILANNFHDLSDEIRSKLTHFNRVTSGKIELTPRGDGDLSLLQGLVDKNESNHVSEGAIICGGTYADNELENKISPSWVDLKLGNLCVDGISIGDNCNYKGIDYKVIEVDEKEKSISLQRVL